MVTATGLAFDPLPLRWIFLLIMPLPSSIVEYMLSKAVSKGLEDRFDLAKKSHSPRAAAFQQVSLLIFAVAGFDLLMAVGTWIVRGHA
jgi:hypothetical protein